jgi:hypothetical protein
LVANARIAQRKTVAIIVRQLPVLNDRKTVRCLILSGDRQKLTQSCKPPKPPISPGSAFAAMVIGKKIIAPGRIAKPLLPWTKYLESDGTAFMLSVNDVPATSDIFPRRALSKPFLQIGAGGLVLRRLRPEHAEDAAGLRRYAHQSIGIDRRAGDDIGLHLLAGSTKLAACFTNALSSSVRPLPSSAVKVSTRSQNRRAAIVLPSVRGSAIPLRLRR